MDWHIDFDIFKGSPKQFHHPGTNMVLDFHGDPCRCDLILFSDGNHNMALKESLQVFGEEHPELDQYFYATTPPGPIIDLLKGESLRLGNLILSLTPHVFIGPPEVLHGLHDENLIARPRPFMRNQGNVILVKKGNPKKIETIHDLARKNVILFLSNPDTERASFTAYMDTLKNLSNNSQFNRLLTIKYGHSIHHREAPESIAKGESDAAMVFYHLGLNYTRKFPELFDIIPLGGTRTSPMPENGNIIGNTSIAKVDHGGRFGDRVIDFLLSDITANIYRHHGLIPLF